MRDFVEEAWVEHETNSWGMDIKKWGYLTFINMGESYHIVPSSSEEQQKLKYMVETFLHWWLICSLFFT